MYMQGWGMKSEYGHKQQQKQASPYNCLSIRLAIGRFTNDVDLEGNLRCHHRWHEALLDEVNRVL